MADVKIPVENATLMVSALKDFGIVNPFMQAAILAILWKESGIQAVRENMNYRDKQGQPGTGIARLRFVFQTAFKDKPDEYVAQFVGQPEKLEKVILNAGDMVYTPPMAAHAMKFLEESIFLTMAKNSRSQQNYESDTVRVTPLL